MNNWAFKSKGSLIFIFLFPTHKQLTVRFGTSPLMSAHRHASKQIITKKKKKKKERLNILIVLYSVFAWLDRLSFKFQASWEAGLTQMRKVFVCNRGRGGRRGPREELSPGFLHSDEECNYSRMSTHMASVQMCLHSALSWGWLITSDRGGRERRACRTRPASGGAISCFPHLPGRMLEK